ncbi:hypothetical protein C0Q70_06413 [Pomacea canaliculata]|uniref:Alpha-galactosidase n=1 Tax=Pomacea canaliculata TaxID=400727 RepID=A0A2T7PNY7_POMCA|nr:hypothetical protein C0Q70_06413 [Pomacea canaliculata]
MIPLVLMAVALGITQALDNGLARTPPMGWLSWERFRCNVDCEKDPENCISERLFKKMADLMVSEGYRDAGYTYLCIDDCWAAMEREPNGSLVADPKRFPSGIRALADYVHAKGLKLGIYGDFGRKTCGGYPGSEFYLQQDAETFASWQVDLLKLDGCQSEPTDDDIGYPVMEFYLNRTGRPILFSCSWPVYQMEHNMTTNYTSVAHTCNTWRNYEDIQDSFDSVLDILDFWGNNSGDFLNLTGPGSFSDPDMLIIGNFGLSPGQERIQMGMWALLAAPLYMSVDLRSIRRESKELLQNKRVIALNNDKLGYPARRVLHAGRFQVWRKMLSTPGAYALGVVNSSDEGCPTC